MNTKHSKLVNSLLELIGWSNELFDEAFSEDMLVTTSGLTYQQAHSLLTINNLKSIAPQDILANNSSAPTWQQDKKYNADAVVTYNDSVYRALKYSIGQEPDSYPESWVKTNYFSVWVRERVKASIAKMLLRVVDERVITFKDKTLVQQTQLQSNTYNKNRVIPNKEKTYVGFELVPARYIGLGLVLSDIKVYTSAGVLNFSDIEGAGIFLPNTQEFIEVNNSTINFADYLTENKLGSIYLLYPQDSLEALNKQALNTKYDWSKKPCRTCSELNYGFWSFWSKYLEVHPLAISDVNDITDVFDITKFDYNSSICYGLNFDIKVYCDITSVLLDNINELKSVLFYQVAVDFLYEMLYNPDVRTNRHAINVSRNDIAAALEVTDPIGNKQGLKVKLDEAYKALQLNLSGISKVCLKCKNNGIKYRTV
jgi:hypothetical protein